VHLLAICYGKWKLNRKPVVDNEKTPLPGVSILKPIVGIDSNLFSNLETFFTLKYPQYELLFCIHSDCDPALMLVQSLRKKYPNVDSQMFIGGQSVGLNPKINNMMPGYSAAKYNFVLISDAGMRMKEDTLLDMVLAMKDNVGMVTQMPFTCDRKGFASTLEKVYFGTAHARIYLSAHFAGVVCSTGMSSIFRKAILDELGGMKSFGQYLAEDYFFACAIASKGWKCSISSQPGWQNSGFCQVGAFHDRIARWAKLRFAMLPHTIIFEPLQECFLLGLISSWAVNVIFGWNSLIFLLFHVLAWMLLDYVLLSVVQNGPLPFGKFEYVVSWLYREMTALPTFLRALFNQTVIWRTGTYRLKWGGVAEEIKKQSHLINS
jgi:ceramide glucosyltransferase